MYPAFYGKVTLSIQSPQKSRFHNVFWYDTDEQDPPANPQDVAEALASAAIDQLTDNIGGILTTADHTTALEAVFYSEGQPYTATGLTTVTGSITGDQLPDYAAVVMQKRTATSGRSGRGRWYVGPVPELFSDENVITDTAHTAYELVRADWFATLDVAGWGFMLPCLNSVKDQVLRRLTGGATNIVLGTIRGRKFPGGI